MTETWPDEEYYDDQYYDDAAYGQAPGRGWSSFALGISGLIGVAVGFACAACIGLGLMVFLLSDSGGATTETGKTPQSAQDWADVFREAGLEAENQQDLSEVGGELPPGALTGVQFDIPSYCHGCGGKIIIFQSQDYVASIADWLKGLGQYVYTRDSVLVQINDQVPEAVAKEYEAVLMTY